MKKAIFILFAVVLTATTNAQVRYTSAPDTNTNATTSYVTFNSVNSRVKSFQASVTKVSGTVTGYVILQGTVDGAAWVNVNTDTLLFTNASATVAKVWTVTATSYNSYRAQFTTSGTQVSFLKLSYLRRQDE